MILTKKKKKKERLNHLMHSENKHIYRTLWVFLLLNLKMQSSSKMSLLFELMVKNMRPNLISNLWCSYPQMKIDFMLSQFFYVQSKIFSSCNAKPSRLAEDLQNNKYNLGPMQNHFKRNDNIIRQRKVESRSIN